MSARIIRNHFRIHNMVNDLFRFLNAFWQEGVNPTHEQIIQVMGITDIHDLYSLSHAITHLKSNNYIQIFINDNGNEVILQGENPFPEHYTYLHYCLEILIIEL